MISNRKVAVCAAVGLVASIVLVPMREAAADTPSISSFTAVLSGTNTVTLSWQSTGGQVAYIRGPKFDECVDPCSKDGTYREDVGWVPLSGSKVIKVDWGTLDYSLTVGQLFGGDQSDTMHATPVTVPAPALPPITSVNPKTVNYFRTPTVTSSLPDHTITWTLPAGVDYVKVYKPNNAVATGVNLTTTSYKVTGAEMQSFLPANRQGDLAYWIEPCKNTGDPQEPICGGRQGSSQAIIRVAPSKFTGDFRQRISGPANFTVSWNANGANYFTIDAPTLLGAANPVVTQATSYTFPQAQVTPGFHTIKLKSCKNYGGYVFDCAYLQPVAAPAPGGTVTALRAAGQWVDACTGEDRCQLGVVGGVPVYSTRAGFVQGNCSCTSIAAGSILAWVDTSRDNPASTVIVEGQDGVAIKQLQVGGPTWTQKSWTGSNPDQFHSLTDPTTPTKFWNIAGFKRHGVGFGGRFDSTGDIFGGGEFGVSILHLDNEVLKEYEIPLKRELSTESPTPVGGPFLNRQRPFLFNANANTDRAAPQASGFFDGKFWFTQGWDARRAGLHAHSRVVSFDPNLVDSDATPDDDRFCIYNVPGNFNGAAGLDWDGQRVWFTEHTSGYLTSFNPDELACENLLDYSTPEPHSSSHTYCPDGPPVQVGCFERVAIPAAMTYAMQMKIDGDDIWMTTYYNTQLVRYKRSTGVFTSWPVPAPSNGNNFLSWGIEVAGNFVYFSEFGDGDIVRFDKTTQSFSEMKVPGQGTLGPKIRGNKLYFITGGIRPDESNVGYIDISTWNSVVIYTGMDAGPNAIVSPNPYPGVREAPGISDIDPVTGRMVGGTYGRNQIVRFVPNTP